MDGLIGHTGFVGGTLLRQRAFDRLYNTANAGEIAGRQFDLLACAAAPGSMFEANRFPERDAAQIDALIGLLEQVSATRLVLLSTVAVLAGFTAEDEEHAAYETAVAYGVNRRRLEAFVAERFPGSLIVRLPALFGEGLRKNFLFDLMNPVPSMTPPAGLDALKAAVGPAEAPALDAIYAWDEALGMHVVDRAALDASGRRPALEEAISAAGLSALRFTNPESRFQFYDMRRLWTDIELALANDLDVVHLAPPPIAAGDVHRALTGAAMPANAARVHAEDMRTGHAALWGLSGPYIATSDTVIEGLRDLYAARRVPA